MADVVNMQQEEYDELLKNLKELHEEEIDHVKELLKKVKKLCRNDGDFYVTQISEKMAMLSQCIEEQIIDSLLQSFDEEMQILETCIQVVKTIDNA